MKASTRRVFFWAPKILAILFAILLSVFAFDVFGEGYGLWQSIGAFALHLVPAAVVIIALAIAWRWEWVGTVVYSVLAVLYVAWAWGHFPVLVYIVVCGPLILMGALFLLNWICKTRLRNW